MYRIRIMKHAQRLGLNRLLTLTLDPAKLAGEDSTRYINEVFADFRVYLGRHLKGKKSLSYIRILEYQKNGNAHLHILVSAYLDKDWIKENWEKAGGGRIVDIRRIVDMNRVSHYLSKYLVKDMLTYAPARARRVTTSRDIRLLEKEVSDFAWNMLQSPLSYLMQRCAGRITGVQSDQDGYLVAFDVMESPGDAFNFQPGGSP